jgi:hypothetical protein
MPMGITLRCPGKREQKAAPHISPTLRFYQRSSITNRGLEVPGRVGAGVDACVARGGVQPQVCGETE